MKIDAKVVFDDAVANEVGHNRTSVAVDMDYVEANEDAVKEWVANELEAMFGRSFANDQFTITNIDDIVESINFDEFEDKTSEF